jgi:hypothetical protein
LVASQSQETLRMPDNWHRGWSVPLYLPELKTVLCTHPKAACSTLRNLVLRWSGQLVQPHWLAHFILFDWNSYNHSFIEKVSQADRATTLFNDPEMLLAVFVRDPISRLVSMFNNKVIEGNDADFQSFDAKLDPTRLVPVFFKADIQTQNHGFQKFIRVLHKYKSYLQECQWEEHIDLQSCRCGHRYIEYDFVGRAEHLSAGLEQWLTRVGRPDLIPVRYPYNSYDMNKSNRTVTEQLYASIDKEDLDLLWDVYGEDYQRFGYPFPPPFLTQFTSKPIS